MKRFLFLLLQWTVLQLCHAQPTQYKKADTYFNQFEFASAAAAYEKVISQDPSNTAVMEKLVSCYQKLNDQRRMEVWLSKICKNETTDVKYFKQYGDVLAANNKHNASIEWYKKYLKKVSDPQTSKIVDAYNNIQQFYRDSSFYSIQLSSMNSGQSDFSPAFLNDGIIFCSARKTSGLDTKYAWDNSAFIDLYFSRNSNDVPVLLDKAINSHLHEGPASATVNSDTLYFTRNSTAKNSNGVVMLQIYYSIIKNGVWQKAQRFQVNSNQYSTGHPAIAPDHKLYFVSDMPGGIGGTDIYWTKYRNGHWTTPVNLGPEINTPGNEMFPFVDQHGDLYFASSTHPGLGGLDIFYAKANSQTFDAPVNLGYPINSPNDDFGLILKNDRGFFSSNRGDNPNDDNLYSVTIDKRKTLNLKVVDGSGHPLENFTVQLSENNYPKKPQTVDKLFTTKFSLQLTYGITCSKEGYQDSELTLRQDELLTLSHNETLTLTLNKASRKISIATVSDDEVPLPAAEIVIKNNSNQTISHLKSDNQGLIALELFIGNQYEITASKINYKTRSIEIATSKVKEIKDGEIITLILPSTTALFDKKEVGQLIEMDIKYDVGKFNIRKDAAKELDRLVVYLKKNPNMKVELGSHTDNRGTDEANHILSQKRAAAAAHYVTSKGIASTRIIPVGYGESDLKVKDAMSDAEHQQNRRTTVKVVGL